MSDRDPARDPQDAAAEPPFDPADPAGDPFHPPSIPTLVECLHCGEEYDSYLIEWRVDRGPDGKGYGMWCCPTAGCDGAGFGFDIHPVDHDYVDPDGRDMGWCDDEPPDPETDDTRPPAEPTQVRCECCGKFYPSDKMVWWVDEDCPEDAFQMHGWMCPVRDCPGMGFGWDVRPTDPDYVDPDGRRVLKPGEKPAPPAPREGGDGGAWEEDDIPF